jgi:hypothetical protein
MTPAPSRKLLEQIRNAFIGSSSLSKCYMIELFECSHASVAQKKYIWNRSACSCGGLEEKSRLPARWLNLGYVRQLMNPGTIDAFLDQRGFSEGPMKPAWGHSGITLGQEDQWEAN